MTRMMHAEMLKLLRRRTVLVASFVTAIYAIGATALVTTSVEADGGGGFGPTPAALADAGGGTELFTTALSFAGFFVLVLITGAVAVEFSRGNVRTMALHQGDRIRLLAGKLAALLGSGAVLLAGAMLLGWASALAVAPTQDIEIAQWTSTAALGEGLADYGTVLLWIAGYAVLGTALAVLVRSVPVALAIGIGWAGPFEHILADAWTPALQFFPGLLLEALVAGGTDEVSAAQALVTSLGYGLVAAGVAGWAFTRRDIA